ncbi:hypothetical protein SCHPADRAFT_904353 [Schizopora paradoxa]|uniref:Large ribosomal subunit protein uL23m n=1 Tax=Schizopora paradoxa TaxID=27342 RepID=A0A0H2RNU5_9AGAM|nr:hypothetical protein SCHPADRAFT_904353 [Schizopora paradoxa]
MFSLASRIFQRTYASTSSAIPRAVQPAKAQAASTPLDVRVRRAAAIKAKESSPKRLSYIQRRRILQPSVSKTDSRSRIRGVKMVRDHRGVEVAKVLGERIYLPNIIFRMVRNHTPPGEAYNPYEATFRIPQSVTKTDIRSYLLSVYGVKCTYIRTDNYLAKVEDNSVRKYQHKKHRSAYKRAVVGLVDPFYYPLAVEDMNGRERWLREATLEEQFRIKQFKEMNKELLVKMTQKSSDSWSLRGDSWQTRAQILKNIWQKREERERKVRETAVLVQKLREEGKLASSSSS